MQLACRHDERPGESYEASDGKKSRRWLPSDFFWLLLHQSRWERQGWRNSCWSWLTTKNGLLESCKAQFDSLTKEPIASAWTLGYCSVQLRCDNEPTIVQVAKLTVQARQQMRLETVFLSELIAFRRVHGPRTSGASNRHRKSVSDTRVPPYQLHHEDHNKWGWKQGLRLLPALFLSGLTAIPILGHRWYNAITFPHFNRRSELTSWSPCLFLVLLVVFVCFFCFGYFSVVFLCFVVTRWNFPQVVFHQSEKSNAKIVRAWLCPIPNAVLLHNLWCHTQAARSKMFPPPIKPSKAWATPLPCKENGCNATGLQSLQNCLHVLQLCIFRFSMKRFFHSFDFRESEWFKLGDASVYGVSRFYVGCFRLWSWAFKLWWPNFMWRK